jgi:hypothetical protein
LTPVNIDGVQKYNKAEVEALAHRIRSGNQKMGGTTREGGTDRPDLANDAAATPATVTDADNAQLSTSNPTAQPLDASSNEDAHAQTVISRAPAAQAKSRAPPKQFLKNTVSHYYDDGDEYFEDPNVFDGMTADDADAFSKFGLVSKTVWIWLMLNFSVADLWKLNGQWDFELTAIT